MCTLASLIKKPNPMKIYLFILSLCFCSLSSYAQGTISGKVVDKDKLPMPGVNVVVVGEKTGTVTDNDGNFTLNTPKPVPFFIEVSMVGYTIQKIEVTSNNQKIEVVLKDERTMLTEIVVAASRNAEKMIESPVAIERMGLHQIKNTTNVSFYDGMANLKEVQMNTSSLGFKSINTRGFAAIGNTRFVQLVDGMDNSSPALNFSIGNLLGISELDIASVEILPGASSALYGANAFNGLLFMTSQSPFIKSGISVYYKIGQTSQETAGTNLYRDFGMRMAYKFTRHFAAKANISILNATEWIASDTRDKKPNVSGLPTNPNYDGVNIYGDEVTTNIKDVGKSLASMGLIPASAVNILPNYNVARTGYYEQDLNDNTVKSVKADFSLYFKPWDNDIEIVLQSKIGTGNTIYQGANRYALANFYMNQNKLEISGDNFFARIYNTHEDAGDSYDMTFAAWNVNRAWKSDKQWFGEYAGAYIQSTLAGQSPQQANNTARSVADTGRYMPGTAQYANTLKAVVANPDLTNGAKFSDGSNLYNADLNYNFKDIIHYGEIQLGGQVRQYELNSEGTIFTDYDEPIVYNEYGIYAQLQNKYLNDKLKFTGSLRYDKSQNFKGGFTPRISFVYTTGENISHNFRLTYQTGFRNPTTQDQYIGLDLGPAALIGSAPENLTRYSETLDVSFSGQSIPGVDPTVTLTGEDAYYNSYTLVSAQAFSAAVNQDPTNVAAAASLLEVANPTLVQPERVQAFEAGYRAVIYNDLTIDINGYYNIYNDFISQSRVITPFYGDVDTPIDFTNPASLVPLMALQNGDSRIFQVYTNSKAQVTSTGFGIGVSKKIYKNFELGANYMYSTYSFNQDEDPSFVPGFNTPENAVKATFGNPKLFTNFGFNLNVRWNTSYVWQSSFVDGIVPENTVLDAQVNYAIPKLKSIIKLGANNLFGKDYIQVVGAGAIGQLWYASLIINP